MSFLIPIALGLGGSFVGQSLANWLFPNNSVSAGPAAVLETTSSTSPTAVAAQNAQTGSTVVNSPSNPSVVASTTPTVSGGIDFGEIIMLMLLFGGLGGGVGGFFGSRSGSNQSNSNLSD